MPFCTLDSPKHRGEAFRSDGQDALPRKLCLAMYAREPQTGIHLPSREDGKEKALVGGDGVAVHETSEIFSGQL